MLGQESVPRWRLLLGLGIRTPLGVVFQRKSWPSSEMFLSSHCCCQHFPLNPALRNFREESKSSKMSVQQEKSCSIHSQKTKLAQPSCCCNLLTQFFLCHDPPTIKSFLLLLHSCTFATVINCSVNIFEDRGLLMGLQPTG